MSDRNIDVYVANAELGLALLGAREQIDDLRDIGVSLLLCLAKARRERDDLLRWLRQTVHQAHHQGAIDACTISTCRAVAAALGEGAR